jgi:hypothetical protein
LLPEGSDITGEWTRAKREVADRADALRAESEAAENVRGPVAWRVTLALGMGYSYVENDLSPTYKCEPLYLAPPPDERVRKLTALLKEAQEYVDKFICYASTRNEWAPNDLAARIAAALAKGDGNG